MKTAAEDKDDIENIQYVVYTKDSEVMLFLFENCWSNVPPFKATSGRSPPPL